MTQDQATNTAPHSEIKQEADSGSAFERIPRPADTLGRMRLFYNVFPYPNRAFWLRPHPASHLPSHAGFARMLSAG